MAFVDGPTILRIRHNGYIVSARYYDEANELTGFKMYSEKLPYRSIWNTLSDKEKNLIITQIKTKYQIED